MQPTALKEAAMRLRSRRNHRRILAIDPRRVTISQSEILDDLLYPARAPRSAARARK
jgi:hypothetical protein